MERGFDGFSVGEPAFGHAGVVGGVAFADVSGHETGGMGVGNSVNFGFPFGNVEVDLFFDGSYGIQVWRLVGVGFFQEVEELVQLLVDLKESEAGGGGGGEYGYRVEWDGNWLADWVHLWSLYGSPVF
jgi:hypothetical protein